MKDKIPGVTTDDMEDPEERQLLESPKGEHADGENEPLFEMDS